MSRHSPHEQENPSSAPPWPRGARLHQKPPKETIMLRHSVFASIVLLIATTAILPALAHAQGQLTCTQALAQPLSASTVARAQDQAGNPTAALASNELARIGMQQASVICNSVLTGQDLALYQQIMFLANQFAAQASVADQLNQIPQAIMYETQLSLSLEQAMNVANGR
jgi:hypothetical protein